MRTEQELDAIEDRIGTQPKCNVDHVPSDEAMQAMRDRASRTNLAMPRVSNMAKSGVRSQGGLEWLRRLIAPEVWRDKEYSRRIKIGEPDAETLECFKEITLVLRLQLALTEYYHQQYRKSLAKRTARQLESWWRSVSAHDRNIGMRALRDKVGDLETYWSQADLDARVDMLALAMWSIEEHHQATEQAAAMAKAVATPPPPAPQATTANNVA